MTDAQIPAPKPKRANYYPRRQELAKQRGFKNYGEERKFKLREAYGVESTNDLRKRNQAIKQYSQAYNFEFPGKAGKVFKYQDMVAIFGKQGAAEWYAEWIYLKQGFQKEVNNIQHPYIEPPGFFASNDQGGLEIQAPTNPGWWAKREEFSKRNAALIEEFQRKYSFGIDKEVPIWAIWYH